MDPSDFTWFGSDWNGALTEAGPGRDTDMKRPGIQKGVPGINPGRECFDRVPLPAFDPAPGPRSISGAPGLISMLVQTLDLSVVV